MGGTWDLDLDGFLLLFFFLNEGCVLVTDPPPSSRVASISASSSCHVHYTSVFITCSLHLRVLHVHYTSEC